MDYVFNSLNGFWKYIQKNQQRRADYWILQNMSDKQLKDMGISRGEIYSRIYDQLVVLTLGLQVNYTLFVRKVNPNNATELSG